MLVNFVSNAVRVVNVISHVTATIHFVNGFVAVVILIYFPLYFAADSY